MKSSGFSASAFLLFIFSCLAAWAVMQAQTVMNADNIWLSEALRRYLFEGLSATEGWVELNPPPVMFMYTVPVLLHQFLHWPLHYTVFIQTEILVLVFTGVLWAILRRWDFLDKSDRAVLVISFLVANTILAGAMTGERDHWVALGLVPFVMIQMALTQGLPSLPPRLRWLVCQAGAFMIILKPHYGLLPAILIAYRLVRQRRLPGRNDIDLIALAVGAFLYIMATFIFFPDYVSQIFPAVFENYILQRDDKAVLMMLAQYGLASLALMAFYRRESTIEKKRFGYFLLLAALINLIPFWVQGKGYAYHLLPANAFLWMGLGFWLWLWLERQIKSRAAFFISILCVVGCAWAAQSVNDADPTHEAYRQLPLVKVVSDCGKPECSAFIFSVDLETVQKISYYADVRHASRFPCYWTLPPLVVAEEMTKQGQSAHLSEAEIAVHKDKLALATAQDLARYQPDVLLIAKFEIIQGQMFDFGSYFSTNSDFAREWRQYQKTETVTAPYDDYHAATLRNKNRVLEYDIYHRKSGT